MFFKRKTEPKASEAEEFSDMSWQELRDKLEELDVMYYPKGREMVTEILKRIMDRIAIEEERL
jgi:hypothetical protein